MNIVELELKIDVNEDIKAAIMQANVKPRIARRKEGDLFCKSKKKLTIGH